MEDGQEAKPGEEEREAPPAPEEPQNQEAPPGLEGPQNHGEPPVPEGSPSPEDIEYERQGMEEEVQDQSRGSQAGRPGAAAHAQLGGRPKPQGMNSGAFLGLVVGAFHPLGPEGPDARPQHR